MNVISLTGSASGLGVCVVTGGVVALTCKVVVSAVVTVAVVVVAVPVVIVAVVIGVVVLLETGAVVVLFVVVDGAVLPHATAKRSVTMRRNKRRSSVFLFMTIKNLSVTFSHHKKSHLNCGC